MNLPYRRLKTIFFCALITCVAFVISCVEIGPVPEFEYSYEFDVDIDEPDTSSFDVPTVELTAGSIDNSGTENFSSTISNSVVAETYSDAIESSLSATLQAFWSSQNVSSITSGLENESSAIVSSVNSTLQAFENSSVLSQLLPVTTSGTISSARVSSSSSRTSSVSKTSTISQTTSTDDEFDECKAAAQAAYDEGVEKADSLFDYYSELIETAYAAKVTKAESQRSTLSASVEDRHDERVAEYLTQYNTTESIINGLSISEDVEENLRIINLALYGISYLESLDLDDAEIELIDEEIDEIISNLGSTRTELLNSLTSSYNSTIQSLASQYSSSYNACHNQGGVNSN